MKETIYDVMRPGSRNQWKRRKKQLRKMGLNSGDWHTMSLEQLSEYTIRKGMTVQNVTGRPALYEVIQQRSRLMLVNLKTNKVKELDNPRKYRWVRA